MVLKVYSLKETFCCRLEEAVRSMANLPVNLTVTSVKTTSNHFSNSNTKVTFVSNGNAKHEHGDGTEYIV
jgi:hypothetical protein